MTKPIEPLAHPGCGSDHMTVEDLINQLRLLPKHAVVGIYNPCVGETIYLETLELTNNFVQMLFEEEPKTGHSFAPL